MAAAKRSPASKARAPTRIVADEELASVVQELLTRTPGLKHNQVKKHLPKSYQALAPRALELLRTWAQAGKLFRHKKGATERFFTADPQATLKQTVRELLAREPLDAKQLKQAVETEAPGHGDLVAEWLKPALGRRELFEQYPAFPKATPKAYGLEPDPRPALKSTFVELRKALARLEALGVARARVAELLLAELGVTQSAPRSSGPGLRDGFLAALEALAAEKPQGALLSVSELRGRCQLDKLGFDETALQLAREGVVVLHHHDYPASLSDSEREALIKDTRGTYYLGIAPGGAS